MHRVTQLVLCNPWEAIQAPACPVRSLCITVSKIFRALLVVAGPAAADPSDLSGAASTACPLASAPIGGCCSWHHLSSKTCTGNVCVVVSSGCTPSRPFTLSLYQHAGHGSTHTCTLWLPVTASSGCCTCPLTLHTHDPLDLYRMCFSASWFCALCVVMSSCGLCGLQ